MNDLFLKIEFNIETTEYLVDTNINKNKIEEIVSTFLNFQIGAGKDNSNPNTKTIYTIKIFVDLSFDKFTCEHDCGNKGLRDGILMHYLKGLK